MVGEKGDGGRRGSRQQSNHQPREVDCLDGLCLVHVGVVGVCLGLFDHDGHAWPAGLCVRRASAHGSDF